MVNRYDFIDVKATVSSEGWIRDKPIITRSGIFEYRDIQGKVKKEYRPETEVFDNTSLSTLNGIPITDGHIGIITAKNHKGVIGAVISPGVKSDNDVVADIIIHDTNKLGDRRHLSLGYVCDLDETPGVTESGEKYDAKQLNIKYNHLAVVKSGRAGNAKLRLDSNSASSEMFEQENNPMDGPKLTTVKFDNIDYVASPEVANRLSKYETDLADLKSKHDTLEAERDTLKASHDEEKTKSAEATKAAIEAAKSRLKLEDVAEKAGIKLDEKMKDRDIKIDIISKLKGDTLKFDGKSDDYVSSAFDIVMSEEKNKDDKLSEQRKKFVPDKKREDNSDKSTKNVDYSADAARERMMNRIRGQKVEA